MEGAEAGCFQLYPCSKMGIKLVARHSAESSHRSQLTIRHGSLSVIQDNLQSQMENLRVKLANGQNDNTNRKYLQQQQRHTSHLCVSRLSMYPKLLTANSPASLCSCTEDTNQDLPTIPTSIPRSHGMRGI